MKLLEFRQTVFVDKNNLNKVIFKFDDVIPGSVLSILGTSCTIKDISVQMLIPSVHTKTIAAAVLTTPSGDSATYTVILNPVSPLDVCIVYTSSNDYKSFAYEHDDYNSKFLKKVCDYAEAFPDYRYTAHSISVLDSYEIYNNDLSELRQYIKSGNIEINPVLSGLQTHLLSAEELARAFYKIPKLKNKLNAQPETVIFKDVSGFSQDAIGVMTSAGIKNIILAPSDYRNIRYTDNFPPLFKTPSSDGMESVTVLILPEHERKILSDLILKNEQDSDIKGEFFACRIAAGKTDYSQIESRIDKLSEKYKDYGTIPLFTEKTGSSAALMPYVFCSMMNAKWKYPRFKMATATEAMQNIKMRCKTAFPQIRGELNEHLSDTVTAFPELFSKKNRLSSLFSCIESICTLNSLCNKSYPAERLNSALSNLLEFCRYTTDCNSKKPQNELLFNYNYSKRFPVDSAGAILSNINTKPVLGKSEKFSVFFNPLLTSRFPYDSSWIYGSCKEHGTTEIPQFGFASSELHTKSDKNSFGVTPNTVTTPYYNISYCNKTGRIFSIVSRKSLKELIDNSSQYALGDYIYAVSDSKSSPICSLDVQEAYEVKIITEKNHVTIQTCAFEEESRSEITRRITFYRNSKNIDISVSFNNTLSVQGDFSDRFRKNIFIALPIMVKDADFITGRHTGFINEATERIPLGVRDFSVSSGWIAACGKEYGVAVISHDARIFHYGSIQYNHISQNSSSGTSHLYAYVLSNRLNSQVFRSPDDCKGNFTITLLPFKSSELSNLTVKIYDILTPYLAYQGYILKQSKISADTNLNLTAFKPSEDRTGYILRFAEQTGESKTATLNLPFKIKKAFYTNIIEENILEIKDFDVCSIKIRIKRMSYTTIKLIPNDENKPSFEVSSIPEITDFYSYKDKFDRNVVVWNKKSFKNSYKYDIICDGMTIATEDNLPYLTQMYTTGITGNHSFEVKIRE